MNTGPWGSARTREWVVAVLAGAALVAGCGATGPAADQRARRAAHGRGDILIGVAWPFSAHPDIRYADGLEMAVDEINAAGGVMRRRIRLERVDDHESVDEGRIVAQQLAADLNVVAVIGHLQSYVSVPAAAIYDLSGLVMIAPTATDPELTARGYTRVFRATFTDRRVGRAMADFAARHGYQRVAICYIRDAYGRDLANAFEERANEIGLTVAARQSYDPTADAGAPAFENTIASWRDTPFDAIFVAGEVPSAGAFIAQARKAGITAPILGSDAMNSPALARVGGAATDGTIVPSVFHPDEPRPEVRRFVEAFTRRYGRAPDAGSALGYDAVKLLAHAIEQAHSSVPDDIARALHRLRDWPGVTGRFTFDSAGDLADQPLVETVLRHGRFEYLPGAPPALAAR